MLVVVNLANTKWCIKPRKWLKPWHVDTHLGVLSESYPMNTNMIGFRWFSKIVAFLCFGQVALALEGFIMNNFTKYSKDTSTIVVDKVFQRFS